MKRALLPGNSINLIATLAFASLGSVGLYLARVIDSDNGRYGFLIWNLFLAWLPLIFAGWLVQRLDRKPWASRTNIVATLLWLGFLPNSFYLASDLIHLTTTGEVGLLYDAVMFLSFILNAFMLGYLSLYLIHKQIIKRIGNRNAHTVVAAIILACSFAVYLGRFMRWNTWDVLVNPAGILFDVSDRFLNPAGDPQFVVTTVTFFVLIGSAYVVVWQAAKVLEDSISSRN